MEDIILVSLRDFQNEKADVILKYTADEAEQLKSKGHIPENTKITDTSQFGVSDDAILFKDCNGEGEDDGAMFESNDPASNNLNRSNEKNNNKITQNVYSDISDSDDD